MDRYPRSLKGLEGIGPAVTGKYRANTLLSHELCGLDPGPTRGHHIRVFNRLGFHCFAVDNHKVTASAKPRIDLGIKTWTA
jgi:hypothetical protein